MRNQDGAGAKIRYDEERGAEYVMYRGKRVYGSWNEQSPSKKNRVRVRGLRNYIKEDADGTLRLDEARWDKRINR